MMTDSLFKSNLAELEGKAYDLIVMLAGYNAEAFNEYWKGFSELLVDDRNRTSSDFFLERAKLKPNQEWVDGFQKWYVNYEIPSKESTSNDIEVMRGDRINERMLTDFRKQINSALFKDSQNRADLLLDFFQEKGDDVMSAFGFEATDLIYEIVGGLKKEEDERLGKPKPVAEPAKAIEKTDEEVIDDLDFLDDDIDEVFNLEELEEELDLDDLNLD